MAYSRGQALFALDRQRELEEERRLFEEEQERMSNRSLWATGLSTAAGLATAAGMFNPLLGLALQGAGRLLPRAIGAQGVKGLDPSTWKKLKLTKPSEMYGYSDEFEQAVKGGRFTSPESLDALSKLEGSEHWFGDFASLAGAAGSAVTQAGGLAALKESPVGALKEMTTFGKSWEGGKPGLFGGGYVPQPQEIPLDVTLESGPQMGFQRGVTPTAADYGYMSAKDMWKAGMLDLTESQMPGYQQVNPQGVPGAVPGKYTRANTLGMPKPTGKRGLSQAKLLQPSTWTRPFGLDIMTGGPGFSAWDYATDVGAPYLTQQLATIGSPGWMQQLYPRNQ